MMNSRYLFRLGCLAAGAAWFATVNVSASFVLYGDAADFESQWQRVEGGPPSVASTRGEADELRVFARDTDGFLFEQGRPVFQFDLSAMTQPAASAVFSVALLSVSTNVSMAIEVWGVNETRSGPLDVASGTAAGQFESADYVFAHGAGTFLVDETADPGAVSVGVTDYLNDRYSDYLAGGNSWIYLRLQPSYDFYEDTGLEGSQVSFGFASSDYSESGSHPSLEIQPVPEPAGIAILAGLGALAWVLGRRVFSVSRTHFQRRLFR